MADNNRVHTATFRAKEEGVDAVAQKLGGLANAAGKAENATERFTTTTEQSGKRLGTIQRRAEDLQRSLEGSPAAWKAFERGMVTAGLALDAGKFDAQEYAKVITDLQQRLQKTIAPRLGMNVDESGLARMLDGTKQVSAATRAATRDMLSQAQAAQESALAQAKANDAIVARVMRLREEVDPLTAAQARLNAEIAEYNGLAASGHISTTELAAATAQANSRFTNTAARLGQVSSEVKLTSFQMTNLGYQVNDIGTMLAMGASPFQIMASQAGQVYQALGDGPGGVRGSLGAIKTAVAGFVMSLGPAGAAVTALGLAASSAYFLMRDRSEPVNDLIERQAALLRDVRNAYGATANAAQDYARKAKRVIQAEVNDELAIGNARLQELREQLNADAFSGRDNARNRTYLERSGDTDFTAAIAEIRSANPDLAKAQELLAKVEQSGAPEHIRDLAKSMRESLNPMRELQGTVVGLSRSTDEFTIALRKNRAAFEDQRKVLAGHVTDTRTAVQQIEAEYEKLMRLARTEADVRAADDLRRGALRPIIDDARSNLDEERFKRSLVGIDAETAALRENARTWEARINEVEGNAEAVEALTQASVEAANAIREQFAFDAGEKAKEEAKAYREATAARLQGISDTVSGLETERDTLGMTEGAAAAYRFQVQALTEAKRAAAEAGGYITPEELAVISDAAARIRDLTDETHALREAEAQRKRVQETIDDLEFQSAIAGFSQLDQEIATTLRNLAVTADSVDGQRVAGALRYQAEVNAQNEALETQRDILENVASTFLDIFTDTSSDDFFGRIMSGLADIGRQFAELGKQKLMENLFGQGFNYTAGQPAPGQRSVAPAGFPAGYGQGASYGIEPRNLTALNDNLRQSSRSALDVARQFDGLNEKVNTGRLDAFMQASGTWGNLSAKDTAWCAAFANAAIMQAGGQGTNSNLASSFMGWGQGTNAPKIGDIVVLKPQSRGASGHVGFVAGFGDGSVQVFGGNQSNGANTKSFGLDQVRGYRTMDESVLKSGVSAGLIDATRRMNTGQAGPAADPFTGYMPGTGRDGGGYVQQGGLFGPRGQSMLQVGGAALGAFGSGYSSGSPLAGGFGGAMSGYGAAGSIASAFPGLAGIAGPVGMIGGAALGILGGIFGARQKRKQEHQNRAQEWAQMQPQYLEWQKQFDGNGPNSGLRQTWNSKTSEFDNFVRTGAAAWKYGSGNSSAEFQNVANTMFAWEGRMRQSFQDAFEPTLTELRDGFGFDGPFLKARDAVRALEERVETFVDDTVYTFGTGNDALAQAREASAQFALTTLSGADGLSEMGNAIQDLQGRASFMPALLQTLGYAAEEAGRAVDEALIAGMNRLRGNFVEQIEDQINALDGKAYLAEFRELIEGIDRTFADANLLNVDTSLVETLFARQAQAIVDGSELAGDAFEELIVLFPRLAGVVTQFAVSANALSELQAYSGAEVERAMAREATARANLRAAYEREKSELDSLIDRHTRYQEQIKGMLQDMRLGDTSPLSGFDQFTQAQKQFRELQAKALAGDEDAKQKLLSASQTYLDEARSYYASSEQYYAAFSEVEAVLKAADVKAGQQITAAQAQLKAMERQVSALISIDDGVLSVSNAVREMSTAMRLLAEAQAGLNGVRDWGSNTVRNQTIVRDLQSAGLNFTGNFGAGGFGAWLDSLSVADRDRALANANRYMHIGYASGGLVTGPGTGTSDSIRAMLSNGEYVVPAARVPANISVLENIRLGRADGENNRELIAEVRSLRDEVRSLRNVTAQGAMTVADRVEEGNGIARQRAGLEKRASAA